MNTYEVIKSLCEKKGIAVTALEKELGFGRGSIGKMKKGGQPSAKRLKQIADYFEVPLEYFTGDEAGGLHVQRDTFSIIGKEAFINVFNRAFNEIVSEDEQELLSLYKNLNEDGKDKLMDYLLDLLEMPKYVLAGEETLAAAHAHDSATVEDLREDLDMIKRGEANGES